MDVIIFHFIQTKQEQLKGGTGGNDAERDESDCGVRVSGRGDGRNELKHQTPTTDDNGDNTCACSFFK